jgi:cytochrome b561
MGGDRSLDSPLTAPLQALHEMLLLDDHYDRAAIALHWLTAALIAANLLLGLAMVPLPITPRKLEWYVWHKSIGITIFTLTSLRLAWRAVRPHPHPVPMPAWQRRAAAASHALLYVLLLVIPVSGWLYSSATGVQVSYLGLFALPNLVDKDKALGDALRLVHVGLNSLLVAVVLVHVVAAIKHHLVDRDEALVRMLPILRRTT